MLGNLAMSIRTVKMGPKMHTVPTPVAWLDSGSAETGHVSWTAGGVMASTTVVMPRMSRTAVSLASLRTFQGHGVVYGLLYVVYI